MQYGQQLPMQYGQQSPMQYGQQSPMQYEQPSPVQSLSQPWGQQQGYGSSYGQVSPAAMPEQAHYAPMMQPLSQEAVNKAEAVAGASAAQPTPCGCGDAGISPYGMGMPMGAPQQIQGYSMWGGSNGWGGGGQAWVAGEQAMPIAGTAPIATDYNMPSQQGWGGMQAQALPAFPYGDMAGMQPWGQPGYYGMQQATPEMVAAAKPISESGWGQPYGMMGTQGIAPGTQLAPSTLGVQGAYGGYNSYGSGFGGYDGYGAPLAAAAVPQAVAGAAKEPCNCGCGKREDEALASIDEDEEDDQSRQAASESKAGRNTRKAAAGKKPSVRVSTSQRSTKAKGRGQGPWINRR